MSIYREVHISAKDEDQANAILNALLKEQIATGGLLFIAPARFLWKEKLVDLQYFNITAFTTEKHVKAIVQEVKKVSGEELPMVWFTEIDGDESLLKWIDDLLK
jgi:uncharacterized protein involved in tolerance to divalent cations